MDPCSYVKNQPSAFRGIHAQCRAFVVARTICGELQKGGHCRPWTSVTPKKFSFKVHLEEIIHQCIAKLLVDNARKNRISDKGGNRMIEGKDGLWRRSEVIEEE
ncbi:hypothetical protein EVAR_30854_1 [Eumeta japonica]|uniref:Uncharacterized protein n=1 Tax=Eumeta variegata TaxID=151549 RepID=A0A4C1XTC3_EUMVA|nr:hypothetical protein EVAR_30854_1 [Eumeta japonica]